ncbi:MAG: hypothetical protein NVS3B7_01540 [Candidatus Elarobacter sp.]
MLRTVLLLVAVAVATALAGVQLASTAAYGDLAVRPSLPVLLHARAPGLLRPLLGGTSARAAASVHNGDLTTARALVATLPDDATTADLRGRIAEAEGRRDAAVEHYVRAGDVVRAQALIDGLAQTDPARALHDQELLVAGLRGDARAAEVTGQAWWRLGELQALAGYRDAARRTRWWHDAQTSYERALAYAPNEETYLLAAGYQSLANGDVEASSRRYARAVQVVPNSAAAYAGLAWTAAARGGCAQARDALARSRVLAAAGVRDPADDPNVGAPLKRCLPAP